MSFFIARFDPAPEGGFTVTFPQAPSIVTEGDNFEEALRNAREALDAALGGDTPAPVLDLDLKEISRGIAFEGATPVAIPFTTLVAA
jgi:predicted RNase H-like HicB family nuclease